MSSDHCEINFKVKFYTQLSEQVKVLGNIPQLGAWDPSKAFPLTTSPEKYPFWVSETPIQLKKGTKIEFKFARFVGDSLKQWENLPSGENRHYRVMCYKTTLECFEGSTAIAENIVQRFLSNDAIPSGYLKVRKKIQRSDDDFNPFEAAQNLSLSDDSFTSNEFRSDFEDSNLASRFMDMDRTPHAHVDQVKVEPVHVERHEEPVQINHAKVSELIEKISPSLLPQRHQSDKNGSRNEVRKKSQSSKIELALELISPKLKKPVFMEDLPPFTLGGSNEDALTSATLQPVLGPSKIKTLLKNIEPKDDVFTKIFERMFPDKKQPKNKSTTLVKCFDEHEGFSSQFDYSFNQSETKKFNVLMAVYQLPFSIKFNKHETEKNKRWQITLSREPYLAMIYRYGTDKYKNMKWVGWPGIDLEVEFQEELTNLLRDEWNAVPIFIDAEVRKNFDDQYCKKLLASAFCNTLDESCSFDQSDLIAVYRKINQLFAEKLIAHNDNQSIILIRDYELLLVPKYLSLGAPKQAMGFMFETAFPTVENFMRLSHREEFLSSILACDLVCFNTCESVQAFCNTCEKVFNLRYDTQRGGHLYLNYFGRRVFINIMQNAIEPELVTEVLNDRTFEQTLTSYQQKYADITLMLCVTYFHPSEGLTGLCEAMKEIFTANQSAKYKLVILPAQGRGLGDDTSSTTEYKRLIHEKITTINQELVQQGIHSSITVEEEKGHHEYYAMMSLAVVFFAFAGTFAADIKALEYIAVKKTTPAAVVRSKWLLAKKNLNIIHKINPYCKEETVKSLLEILSHSDKDAEYVFELDKAFVYANSTWNRFGQLLQDLSRLSVIRSSMNLQPIKEQERIKVLSVPERFRPLNVNQIKEAFAKAKNRLIIINCENVLEDMRTYEKLQNLKAGEQPIITLTKDHMDLLKKFSKEVSGQLYIVSSQHPDSLNYLYENLTDLSILAENGFLYKVRKESKWNQLFTVDWSFKTIVQKIMQNYKSRTEGSRLELKESSICWNCVDVGTQIGEMQIEELKNHLTEVLEFLDHIEILYGNSWIEVKPVGINKGIATELILARSSFMKGPIDFVLCIGADSMDEEMYQKVNNTTALIQDGILDYNAEVYSVVVGSKPSHANYYLNNTSEVYSLISKLLE